MKKIFKEFKEFALRGNAFDLAVGVIIGAAIKSVIDSLVNDILSPFLGTFLRTDFSNLTFSIRGVDIRYGAFITTIINFFIMAVIIFTIVKLTNMIAAFGKKALKIESEPPHPTTKTCPYCKSEISIEAVRCPHCTSILDNEVVIDT